MAFKTWKLLCVNIHEHEKGIMKTFNLWDLFIFFAAIGMALLQ